MFSLFLLPLAALQNLTFTAYCVKKSKMNKSVKRANAISERKKSENLIFSACCVNKCTMNKSVRRQKKQSRKNSANESNLYPPKKLVFKKLISPCRTHHFRENNSPKSKKKFNLFFM